MSDKPKNHTTDKTLDQKTVKHDSQKNADKQSASQHVNQQDQASEQGKTGKQNNTAKKDSPATTTKSANQPVVEQDSHKSVVQPADTKASLMADKQAKSSASNASSVMASDKPANTNDQPNLSGKPKPQHQKTADLGGAASDHIKTEAKATDPVAPPAQPKRSKGLWLLFFLMVLGWLGFAALAYWYHQKQAETQERWNGQIMTLGNQAMKKTKTKLEKVDGDIAQLQQSVKSQLATIERGSSGEVRQLRSQLKEHEARLNGQQQRLAGLSTTSKEDWLLAEAEYLLKLANQRVLLERTPDNVVALLTRADEIIQRVAAGLGDRELFAIRKLLAKETTALNIIEPVDTQGIYLKLGALADAINTLPTLPTEEERFVEVEEQAVETESAVAEIKREMGNVLNFIKNSFSLKSEDALANPIVSQQRLQLMQLNTRLLIEQAQISLLKEETTSYQASLKAAAELINDYFFESPARRHFSQELTALAAKEITIELPDISGSLKLLHSYVAEQHRVKGTSTGAPVKGKAGSQ